MALGGQLARAYYLNAKNQRSIEVADMVLETAERGDTVGILADLLVTKGSALDSIGRRVEGDALLQAAQDIAEAHGLTETYLRALGNRLRLPTSSRIPRWAVKLGRRGISRRSPDWATKPARLHRRDELVRRNADRGMGLGDPGARHAIE